MFPVAAFFVRELIHKKFTACWSWHSCPRTTTFQGIPNRELGLLQLHGISCCYTHMVHYGIFRHLTRYNEVVERVFSNAFVPRLLSWSTQNGHLVRMGLNCINAIILLPNCLISRHEGPVHLRKFKAPCKTRLSLWLSNSSSLHRFWHDVRHDCSENAYVAALLLAGQDCHRHRW